MPIIQMGMRYVIMARAWFAPTAIGIFQGAANDMAKYKKYLALLSCLIFIQELIAGETPNKSDFTYPTPKTFIKEGKVKITVSNAGNVPGRVQFMVSDFPQPRYFYIDVQPHSSSSILVDINPGFTILYNIVSVSAIPSSSPPPIIQPHPSPVGPQPRPPHSPGSDRILSFNLFEYSKKPIALPPMDVGSLDEVTVKSHASKEAFVTVSTVRSVFNKDTNVDDYFTVLLKPGSSESHTFYSSPNRPFIGAITSIEVPHISPGVLPRFDDIELLRCILHTNKNKEVIIIVEIENHGPIPAIVDISYVDLKSRPYDPNNKYFDPVQRFGPVNPGQFQYAGPLRCEYPTDWTPSSKLQPSIRSVFNAPN